MSTSYFFKDKLIFGLDIGFSSIKVMQLECVNHRHRIVGYGVGGYDANSIKDSAIIDHESIANSIRELFKKGIVGEINTRRVAMSVPSSKTYTRTLVLPLMKPSEIEQAVQLEAEQYIPASLSDLYVDYTEVSRNDKNIELLVVAAPKKIVDSYMDLSRVLGLETVAIDTSITAAGRLFELQDIYQDVPSVLIDFGAKSADITVHDKTVIVTGTIPFGGDIFDEHIAKALHVSPKEAYVIKTRYGLNKSKKQDKILSAVQPGIDQLVKEIKRMIRYHDDRSGSKQKIGQIVTMGGGANVPGLSEHLTKLLRLPARTYDPWTKIDLNKLQPPSSNEKSMYITVAGLSLINTKELFR